MVQTITGATLTAPTGSISRSTGQTFDMSGTYTVAGHGGEEVVSLYWEFATASGGPYTTIPAAAAGLTCAAANPTSGTDSTLTYSVTITAESAATYFVRLRAVGTSTFTTVNQQVTVTTGPRTGTLAAFESGIDAAAMAGSVAISGAATAVEAGLDTAAFAGELLASGLLAAVEAGSDTAAMSGTVSDPGSTGTLAATEAGADILAGSGALSISGALAGLETGADVFAGLGSAAVTGTFGAIEAGADAAAMAGEVSGADITGTLAAAEIGEDIAGIIGEVPVLGLIAANETGSDTFYATDNPAQGETPVEYTIVAVSRTWPVAAQFTAAAQTDVQIVGHPEHDLYLLPGATQPTAGEFQGVRIERLGYYATLQLLTGDKLWIAAPGMAANAADLDVTIIYTP